VAGLDWFNEARYGMFIHWGAYSVAARGEWVANRERIPRDEYVAKYVDNWRAENYRPEDWVALAKDAGMKYMVLTTRHHDGFSLWDTKQNDFNAAKMGPKRDLIGPYAEAVRSGGLKLGFYYSPAAWYHEDYPGAYFRDWPGDGDWKDDATRERFIEFYRAQLIELMTNYGKVDVLWYDGCIPGNLRSPAINEEVKKLQPDILLNERNGEPYDYRCSEQAIKPAPRGVSWEACMTLNKHWGYTAADHDYKQAGDVIEMLLTTAKSAGNLLLNVGPMADGTVPPESCDILREAGAWIARNEASIRGSDRSPFGWHNELAVTTRGSTVYLHLVHCAGPDVCWAELENEVLSARFLATGDEVAFEQDGPRVFLRNLPDPLPDAPVCTIALEVDGTPTPATSQTTFWIPG